MAVYTQVSEEELRECLKRYDLGTLTSFKGIAEGVENTNFLLQCKSGHYILTLYEKRVHAGDLPFFLELLEHLHARGIACPQPVADSTGNKLTTIANRPAALFTFLEGIAVSQPKATHCLQLGEALANLHIATKDFTGVRKNTLSLAGWQNLSLKIGNCADNWRTGMAEKLEEETEFLMQHWPRPGSLPGGIIHADLFPDNVFFLDDRLSGLIDFYFSCSDFLAYDLMICLNAWCFTREHELNHTLAAAFLQGYQRHRRLTSEEKNQLPILARGAAWRFFLTRLYDYIHTPKDVLVVVKNPEEYWKKNQFHRYVKTSSAYGDLT